MLIVHGTLVTLDPTNRVIEDGALWIDGDRIVEVGVTKDLAAKHPTAEALDAEGRLILPGMICAHTHMHRFVGRGRVPTDQASGAVWRQIEDVLGYEDMRYSALASCVEAIRSGTTTLFDHLTSPDAIEYSLDALAEAVTQAGLRACLSQVVSDRNGATRARQAVQENARFARRAAQHRNLAGAMGLGATVTISDETLSAAVGSAALCGIGFHVNVRETRGELRDSELRYGARGLERLRRSGTLGPRTLAAHVRSLSPPEMRLLHRSRVSVVVTARSEAVMGQRLTPLADLIRNGVRTCLGCDGFAHDMFAEAQAAYLLHQSIHSATAPISSGEIARMALQENASLASRVFRDRIGQLSAGSLADVILVDCVGPPPKNQDDVAKALTTLLSGVCVDTTIVGGQILMRGRKLIRTDEQAVMAAAHRVSERLWERLH